MCPMTHSRVVACLAFTYLTRLVHCLRFMHMPWQLDQVIVDQHAGIDSLVLVTG